MHPLAGSIKKTLAYFSLFKHPLTKEELYANLWQPPIINYEDFLLNGLNDANEKNGYFYLSGEEDIVGLRREQTLACEHKLKIAIKAARKIRAVPFIRAVFVCNTIGSGTANTKSDIDFFIITAPERIWLVRFFCNFLLKLWGLRVAGKKTEDKICLSFFIDEDNLDLNDLRIINEDVYLTYWIHQLIPVFDPNNFYKKFLKANSWTNKYLLHSIRIDSSYINMVNDSKTARFWRAIWQKIWSGSYGNLIEGQAKGIQLSILKNSLKKFPPDNDKGVILKNGILKFHENDARMEIYKKWRDKCN